MTVVMRPSDCSRVVGTEQLQRSVFPLLLSFPRHVSVLIKQGMRCVTESPAGPNEPETGVIMIMIIHLVRGMIKRPRNPF